MAIAQLKAYDEFVEFITSSPTLEQVTTFRLSDESEATISLLLEANRTRSLTSEEEAELDDYLRLEHIMRKAKIRAFEKLDQRV
jgi:hypothetical protein